MDYFTAIVLGVIQGIAEFLPISSDGHLVIAEHLLGVKENNLAMTVALHIGTLASILVVYRRDILPALKSPRLVLAVIAATLPLVFVGLFVKDAVEQTFGSPMIAGFGLLLTALVVALMPRVERDVLTLEQVTWKQGLIVGLFQTIAVLPGVSRSGMTIFGGLTTGVQRAAAANFSFYIAVPAIAGAAVLHGKDLLKAGAGGLEPGPTLVGMLTSFVVGLAALRLLLGLVSRSKLQYFAWYCAVLGIGVIAWQMSSGG
ncbi:MAG: undecaprenyl-diphosphate phosphatase [Planctomycetaceae bacterium]|nr:undecaprenyl-diphosphate phosphatase [Planctomycetaceae bacterium]